MAAYAQREADQVARPAAESSRGLAVHDGLNARSAVTQAKAIAARLNARAETVQRKPRRSDGLPDPLRANMEAMSGIALDDVRVHRNSDKPAQMQAHAYAQGTDIHLGPGQERHLPHEAWHVVQQKQGRVRATGSINQQVINSDSELEAEADRMGAISTTHSTWPLEPTKLMDGTPIQRCGMVIAQRSVLHKITSNGKVRYYSDLEKGPKDYDTREEATKIDEELASNSGVIASALTTGQKRDRRVPTPYGHANSAVSGKARHQEQGPHSLAFISFEQRLQNRLRKGQHAELADQLVTPDQAGPQMAKEYNLKTDGEAYKRYMLDYKSLYDEFASRLHNDKEPHDIGSAFHLVARKLLQLNPYTTYIGPKSNSLGEDRHGILGSTVLDPKAKYKEQKSYEEYLQTRGDLYHSSDEEDDDFAPRRPSAAFTFTTITPRGRKFSREARKQPEEKKDVEMKESESETDI